MMDWRANPSCLSTGRVKPDDALAEPAGRRDCYVMTFAEDKERST